MPETKALTFEQLCNFVAISQTHKNDEVLAQLILQLVANATGNTLKKSGDVSEAIKGKYGLTVDNARIQSCLDRLHEAKKLTFNSIDGFNTESSIIEEFSDKLRRARELENQVQQEFFNQLEAIDKTLDKDFSWSLLQQYLWRAFRRHGLATISLLSHPNEAETKTLEPLSAILKDVLSPVVGSKAGYERVIIAFFKDVASYPHRTRYITQLADSTFSYCALIAPPEVSAHLRSQLSPLTLFFDTNFIFGLLGLHEHPFVEVSKQLVEIIQINKFPYRLRYRESTLREFTRSLTAASKTLLRQHWPQNISKVVSNNGYLAGIELKFHQANSVHPTDPSAFLAPYAHVDEILKSKGFELYRDATPALTARATIQHDYEEFLRRLRKEKPVDAIEHDAELLEGVRRIRSRSSYSLDSGSLLVTCDFTLQRFDYSDSLKNTLPPSVVLPNQFYQLLRPYVAPNSDFDKSFAQTFAIPEFRLIDSSSQQARSRMVALMSSFGEIPEQTATKILANSLLFDKLHDTASDDDAKSLINDAIVDENTRLLRNQEEISARLRREEALRAETEMSVQKALTEVEMLRKESEAHTQRLEQERADAEQLRRSESNKAQTIKNQQDEISRGQQERQALKNITERAAQETQRLRIFLGVLITMVAFGLWEIAAHALKLSGYLHHPHLNGLRICLVISLVLFSLCFTLKRKTEAVILTILASLVAVGIGISAIID